MSPSVAFGLPSALLLILHNNPPDTPFLVFGLSKFDLIFGSTPPNGWSYFKSRLEHISKSKPENKQKVRGDSDVDRLKRRTSGKP